MDKLVLNEDLFPDMLHFNDSKGVRGDKDWFGIKGARYINHGEWADPEVAYEGKLINYWDIVDYCESPYADYCDENNVDTHKYEIYDFMRDFPDVIEDALIDLVPYAKKDEEDEDINEDIKRESPLYDARSNILELPNGDVLYLDYNEGNLIAGSATNLGVVPEHEIRYDWDLSLDQNIQNLYDFILENNPELNEGLSQDEIKKLEKELRELRSADEPDGARIEEIKKQLQPYWDSRRKKSEDKYMHLMESNDPEYVIWVFCSDENKWRIWGGSHKSSVDKDFLTRINKRIREWNNASDDTPDLYTDVKVVKNGEEPVNEDYANIDPEDSDIKEYKYKGQDIFRIIATRLEGDRTQMFVIGLGTKLEDASFEPVIRSARYTTEESFLFLSAERAEAFLAKFKETYPDADTEGLHVAEYNPLNDIETLIPINSPCGKAYLGMQHEDNDPEDDKKKSKKKDESLTEDYDLNPVNKASTLYDAAIDAIEESGLYDTTVFEIDEALLKKYTEVMANTIEYPFDKVGLYLDISGNGSAQHATHRLIFCFGEPSATPTSPLSGIKVVFNGGAIYNILNPDRAPDDVADRGGHANMYATEVQDSKNRNQYIILGDYQPEPLKYLHIKDYFLASIFLKDFRNDYIELVKNIDKDKHNWKLFKKELEDVALYLAQSYDYHYSLNELLEDDEIKAVLKHYNELQLASLWKVYSKEDLYKFYEKAYRIFQK